MARVQAKTIHAAARAIYESHRFKKPWDHPDTKELWWPICEREAHAALSVIDQPKLKTTERV